MQDIFKKGADILNNKTDKSYNRFNELMKENGMSIPKVSKETGIPITCLYDWKNGNSRPKLEKLLKISTLFNVDVSEFAR